MTTALPAAATATSSTATEADIKNWLTSLHDYLSGMLGTTGVPADARTALGVPASFVTSFNTRTGVVALTSADVINALGYTPASTFSNAVVAISDTWFDGNKNCTATRANGSTFNFVVAYGG